MHSTFGAVEVCDAGKVRDRFGGMCRFRGWLSDRCVQG